MAKKLTKKQQSELFLKYQNNVKKHLLLTFIFSLLFFMLTIAVICFDVKTVEETNKYIGLATINQFIFNLFKRQEWLNYITDIFLYLAIFVMFVFMCIGCYQLIKRKSFKRVDLDIGAMGIVYILIALTYLIFELLVINYRPILIDGAVEASYPSTHSMIIFTVFLTAIFEIKNRINNSIIKKILIILSYIIVVVTFFARFACGYHWFTDVLASLFISLFFTNLFCVVNEIIKMKQIQMK